jgi:Spy/CpxP family protein refolding chaperone
MIQAVNTVQPPLDRFWGLLDDEQKARLSGLGQSERDSRRNNRNAEGSLGQACNGQSGVPNWPSAEIEQRLHPTEAQRASLDNLRDASAKAADMLKADCAPLDALTPPARLAAMGKRLDTMLQAVVTVKSALDDLYKDLTDEQKAQFEAIGPDRTASLSPSGETATSSGRHYRRHRHASIGGVVRRLISFGF